MATLNTITDELISLIQSEYPRFKDPGRIQLAREIEIENLGYEDVILLKPLPKNTSLTLTIGKISTYIIELHYYKKLYQDVIKTISAFAETLDAYLLDYIHHNDYWVSFENEIDYNIDIPDEYLGKINGFIMTFNFIAY